MAQFSAQEISEITTAAKNFKWGARWTMPCIFTGHMVACEHPNESHIRNFSTITRLYLTSQNQQVFLIYRYPLSWIHSLSDNLQRWTTDKHSYKPLSQRVWQEIFESKSLIPLIPVKVTGVVALPYIPNLNFRDVLLYNAGNLTVLQILKVAGELADLVNSLHDRGCAWGELVAHNIIVAQDTYKPTLCDTEVRYYSGVPLERQEANDWTDFILSLGGSMSGNIAWSDHDITRVVQSVLSKIKNPRVRGLVVERCKKRITIGELVFWPAVAGRYECSLRELKNLKRVIARFS